MGYGLRVMRLGKNGWQGKVGVMEISNIQHSTFNDQFLTQGKTEDRREKLWVKGLCVSFMSIKFLHF